MTADATALRVAATITWILTGLFFAIAIFIAVVIPIHAQDALTFGEWSRLISEHWHLHYAAATAQEYGRPLFYVLQGWTWGVFGFHEPLGRILSGLFSLLLLGALAWILQARDWGALAAALGALAVVSMRLMSGTRRACIRSGSARTWSCCSRWPQIATLATPGIPMRRGRMFHRARTDMSMSERSFEERPIIMARVMDERGCNICGGLEAPGNATMASASRS